MLTNYWKDIPHIFSFFFLFFASLFYFWHKSWMSTKENYAMELTISQQYFLFFVVEMCRSVGDGNKHFLNIWELFNHLTHFNPMSSSIPPENVNKPLVFSRFRQVWNWNIGLKCVKFPQVIFNISTRWKGSSCCNY